MLVVPVAIRAAILGDSFSVASNWSCDSGGVSNGIVRAYVDETGDRGTKASSSPYFAFAAVICRDSNRQQLVDELDSLVADLNKPALTTLHWAQNIKHHHQRKLATQRLGALPIRIIYVGEPKSSVAGYLRNSTDAYYNYLARIVVERIALFTRARGRDERTTLKAKVTFGRVKGFHPSVLQSYLAKVRRRDDCAYVDAHLTSQVDVRGQAEERLLQWADIAAGAFDSAARPDVYGNHEPAYLQNLVSRIYKSPQGKVLGWGVKTLGTYDWLTQTPDWPTVLAK